MDGECLCITVLIQEACKYFSNTLKKISLWWDALNWNYLKTRQLIHNSYTQTPTKPKKQRREKSCPTIILEPILTIPHGIMTDDVLSLFSRSSEWKLVAPKHSGHQILPKRRKKSRVTRSGDFSPKCYNFWLLPRISFGLFFAKLLKFGLFLCQNSDFGIFWTFWLLLWTLSGNAAKRPRSGCQ